MEEFRRKRNLGIEIIELKNEISQSLDITYRGFAKSDKDFVKLINASGEQVIDPVKISRASKWGKLPERELKIEPPSISLKALIIIRDRLKQISELSEEELKQLVKEVNIGSDTSPKTDQSSNTFAIDSFIGEYTSFHPDLINGNNILKGTLLLLKNNKKESELKAEYTSHFFVKYKGTCQIIYDTLYLTLKDQREIIYSVANIGVKPDNSIDLINFTSTCLNNNNIPVSFRRILVRKDKSEQYEKAVFEYLKREHRLTKTPKKLYEEIEEENSSHKLSPLLKSLIETYYTSFNLFTYPREKELSKNVWRFYQEGNKVKVLRRGAFNRIFNGEVFQIQKYHIAILFSLKGDENNKRLYIGKIPFKNDRNSPDKLQKLELIGLTLNARGEVIAGREILLKEQVDTFDELEAEMVVPHRLKEETPSRYNKIFNFLENGENATYHLKRHGIDKDPSLAGYFLVYYLNSKTKKLVRNRTRIAFEEDRFIFRYETTGDPFSTLSVHKAGETIIIYLKDERQNTYFAINLIYEKPIRGLNNKVNLMIGSTSSIGYSTGKPVATAILFVRTERDRYEEVEELLGVIDELSPTEKDIKAFLDLIPSNPQVLDPIENIEVLREKIDLIYKKTYVESIKSNILHYMNDGLKSSHSEFIGDLIEVIKGFTTNEEVLFQTRYIALFRIFFDELLRSFEKEDCEFFATSFAKVKYFWHEDNSAEKSIGKFVQTKGIMRRVFFIESLSGIPDEEEVQIIIRHFQIYGSDPNKGEVYICQSRGIPNHLFRPFVTETHGKISWRLTIEPDKTINQFRIYSDDKTHKNLLQNFNEIIGNQSATKKVTKELINSWGFTLE